MSKQTITAMERDLAAAMTRLEQLEQRRELLCKEHVDSVSARRTLLAPATLELLALVVGCVKRDQPRWPLPR